MNKEIIVSVIITTYNRRDYLQEAIDSVLAQSYPHYELIVIDDGSTDGTKELIPSKYEGKLKYIWHENQERSRARNLGISISKGKYLAFLDSDDKWHPDKLREQVKALEEKREKDNDIALVCSSVWIIDGDGNLVSTKVAGRKLGLENYQFEDFLQFPRIYAPPSNGLYVREFVEEVGGFDEDLPPVEDWALLVKLRAKYKFVFINKPLLYYRVHDIHQQGLTSHKDIERTLELKTRFLDRFANQYVDKDKLNLAKLGLYETAAYRHFNIEDWENGKKYLEKASQISNDPVEDKTRVVQKIAYWGLASAKEKGITQVQDFLDFFENQFLKNIAEIWPNDLLNQSGIKKSATAAFCHLIICEEIIPKTRKENLQLSRTALRNGRFWCSFSTWKTYFKNLFLLSEI